MPAPQINANDLDPEVLKQLGIKRFDVGTVEDGFSLQSLLHRRGGETNGEEQKRLPQQRVFHVYFYHPVLCLRPIQCVGIGDELLVGLPDVVSVILNTRLPAQGVHLVVWI